MKITFLHTAVSHINRFNKIVEEKNGHLRKEFSLIMEDSNDLLKPVTAHMPLIIENEHLGDWLSGAKIKSAETSFNPMHLADFITNRVPNEVNDPTANYPELIQPIPKLREEDD